MQIEVEISKGCTVLVSGNPYQSHDQNHVDIKRLSAAAAKAVGALVVVDNTFATPINQNPLATRRRYCFALSIQISWVVMLMH